MTLKLFVADDSVTIQKMISLAFSGEDVQIEVASDGDAALQLVRTFKPDIVLADVFMPGCNGYEVCASIKEDPELKNIPVILLIGTFEPFDEAEARRVKCDGHLTKPFDTAELIQTVHSLSSGQQTRIAATNCPNSVPRNSRARALVSPSARESFLGKSRILDLLDAEALAPADAGGREVPLKGIEKSASEISLSEESLNVIVDRVVRQMSADVIREVAWEVVPELSERIIRSTIRERQESS